MVNLLKSNLIQKMKMIIRIGKEDLKIKKKKEVNLIKKSQLMKIH